MRRAHLILIMIVLATPTLAEEFIFDDTLYGATWLDLRLDVENSIITAGDVRSLQARLRQDPGAFRGQDVRNEETLPQAQREGDALIYRWDRPRGEVALAYSGTIRSELTRPAITQNIPRPYDIPPELSPYLASEEIIQITPEIRALADSITAGEEDAVRATFLMGQWVKDHVEYDLTSVTADAAQTSQWVLDERRGVCDELTSLFIALVRSQGIPARFVSGIAYTNLEELDTHWGPHGWAEVWYPGVGWVPYDITYGQYGYVDATHLALQHSTDAQTTAAEYSMMSVNGHFDPGALTRTVTVADRGPQASDPLGVRVSTALQRAGPGGANRVDVTVKNPTGEYRAAEIYLGRTKGITTTDYTRSILLGPREERTLHWIVTVEEELVRDYTYTFPVTVRTNTNIAAETAFTASSDTPITPPQDLKVPEERSAEPIPLACEAPSAVRQKDPFVVECTTQEHARICILESCAAGTSHKAELSADALGVRTVLATADKGDRHSRRILSVRVLDEPRINLTVSAPSALNTSEEASLVIRVETASLSMPKDVRVQVEHPLFQQGWALGDLERPAVLELRFRGDQLMSGENTLVVSATHAEGREQASARTRPVPDGLLDRFTLWINRAVGWLISL